VAGTSIAAGKTTTTGPIPTTTSGKRPAALTLKLRYQMTCGQPPALGWLVVSQENKSSVEASLISIK
jgi:hypothetical protein